MNLQDPESLAKALSFLFLAISENSREESFDLRKILKYAKQYSGGSLEEREIVAILETPLIDLIRYAIKPKSEDEIRLEERNRIIHELKREFKGDTRLLTRAVTAVMARREE